MAQKDKKSGAVSITRTVKFALIGTTKGAVKYAELNDKGQPIDTKADGLDSANIGMLYLRKKHLNCGDDDAPRNVTVTLQIG